MTRFSATPKKVVKVTKLTIEKGLKNKPIAGPKHPVPFSPPQLFVLHGLMGFIGMRGSGKTLAMVNLVKRYQEEKSFTRTFIICPTYDSNLVFHSLEVQPDDIFKDIHHTNTYLNTILRETKKDADSYREYKKYMHAYHKWKCHKPLTLAERTMLENNNGKRPEYQRRPSPVLVVDDMSHTEIYSGAKTNPFINFCLRHRHINDGIGITILMAAQNYLSGLPKVIRQNLTQLFLWPTKDETQLEAIYSEVANMVDKDHFMALYKKATQIKHGFLTIDVNAKDPVLQFRRNFDTFLLSESHNLEDEDKNAEDDP